MVNSKDTLTILLLVKDRIEFSKRWLEYATLTQQKFCIVVADGSSKDSLRYEVERSSAHLDIQYIYAGPDLTILDFISKVVLSLKVVQTKYTFMASDDDFYFGDALEKSVMFLESKDDFVLCNGGALDFGLSVRPTLKNSIFGEIRYVRKLGLFESFLDDDAISRILQFRKGNRSYWHSVIDTETLLRSWEFAAELKLTRYDTLEDFLNLYWITQGKFMNLKNVTLLFHQVHNNMISQTLESDLERENNQVWIVENQRIEEFISLILKGRSIRREVSPSLGQSVDSRSVLFLNYLKRLTKLTSSLCSKIKYKFEARLNIEPKLFLSDLKLPDITLVQIREIQNFLTNKKRTVE